MYICDMCGKRFESKPDYCDCGNDTFQELKPAVSGISSKPKAPDNKMILWLSVGVIVLLTLVLLLFAPKDNKKIIPDSAGNQPKTTVQEVHNTVQSVIPEKNQISQPRTSNAVLTQKTKQQPVAKTPLKPQVKQPAVKTQVSKPQAMPKQTVSTSKQTASKTVAKAQTGKAATGATTVKKEPAVKPQISQPVKTQPQMKKTTTPKKPAMTEEYYNYKLTLRQALFSKLSVGSVQGSGTCGIEFSIDSTGKLINRGFTFQSDNKSVNDEVYKMLMRMPKFYPPPAGMTSEKIKMVFKFNNGSYYVNYVN